MPEQRDKDNPVSVRVVKRRDSGYMSRYSITHSRRQRGWEEEAEEGCWMLGDPWNLGAGLEALGTSLESVIFQT